VIARHAVNMRRYGERFWWEVLLTIEQRVSFGVDFAEQRHHSRRKTALPLATFIGLMATYAVVVTLVVCSPLLIALPLTIPCGMLIGVLFIVGHDAAHNSLTPYYALNQVVGRIAFLPSLHSFSLWDLSHNRTHHRFNNVRGMDYLWEPATPAEFRSIHPVRRLLYRFWRTPVGVGLYYLPVMWARRLFIPWPFSVPRVSLMYLIDSILLLGFLAAQTAIVASVGASLGRSAYASIFIGIALPFLFWNGLMSFVVFLHHTHPEIQWYPNQAARSFEMAALYGTARVLIPSPFRIIGLAVMDHTAHHFASGVPFYHIPGLQAALGERSGLVSWRFSLREYRRICRRCKLYDYEARRWLAFDEDQPAAGTGP
jgi:omega-6 fatty acid desaturase (delta-12 desaturase)